MAAKLKSWEKERRKAFRDLKRLLGQDNSKWRYYIKFKRKGDWYRTRRDQYGYPIWPRAVWPCLFRTREQAELALKALPIFLNAGERGKDHQRIISASVERTKIK